MVSILSSTVVVPGEISGPRLVVAVAVVVATLTLMSGGSSKLTPTDLHMFCAKPRVTVWKLLGELGDLGGREMEMEMGIGKWSVPCWSETLQVRAMWDWREPMKAGVQKQWTSTSVQPAAVMADSVTFA